MYLPPFSTATIISNKFSTISVPHNKKGLEKKGGWGKKSLDIFGTSSILAPFIKLISLVY
jgi:hypothetical protein